MVIPVVIIIILLAALVFVKKAHAESLDTISRKQAEASKIKAQLETTKVEKSKTQEQLNAELEKIKQLESENTDLKAKWQAKQEALRQATYNSQVKVVAVSGTCSEWLAQAGVTDLTNAIWLINKESGCNPNAVNRSSGSCGVAQELPCGKSGCSLGDGACQVAWMSKYIYDRYGSWANAVAFHKANGWY